MTSERTILHVDMDAFFASVEQHDHPELRGRPVVIGAPRDQRGVVAAASYEARVYGIHSAMPSREAARRCPQAVFLPVNGRRYHEVSRQVFAIFRRFTPLVEPLSVDEAFLDVTGVRRLFGDGPEVAERVRAAVHEETGLTASVGVAANKFLAKLASDMNKPDGVTIVPAAREKIIAFLAPLPVGRIWGVGSVMRATLEQAGIRTIGDLQNVASVRLEKFVGKHGARHLTRLAFGEDARELELEREEKSISREHTFRQDCTSAGRLEGVLCDLVEDVGSRLRGAGRYATVIHLKVRWQGFRTITRQRPLPYACCDDFNLRSASMDMFRAVELVKPVRLIGVGVSGLRDEGGAEQLSLFESPFNGFKREALSRAVDAIREEFGGQSLTRGSVAKRSVE